MAAQVVDAVLVVDSSILFLDVDGPKAIFHDKERFFIAFIKGIEGVTKAHRVNGPSPVGFLDIRIFYRIWAGCFDHF